MNLLCFSHLRWNFVYQRPQHLMRRFSKDFKVYYIEEAVATNERDGYTIEYRHEDIKIVIPQLSRFNNSDQIYRTEQIIESLINDENISDYIFWYYTPMALLFTHNLKPLITIYDCMDELSAFKFAPPQLIKAEKDLLKKADVVFTGGHSLFNAKKHLHHNIYAFPSSIDKEHFAKARKVIKDPEDQQTIPHPRLGFFGVIDERFDINLLQQSATLKPDWHFILIGPVVKISEDVLPKNSNIHYLGSKNYQQLPRYISSWDIALIPFAINESTRFISPTKTPEYLAAGKPVISTAIKDVVHPYDDDNLVHIIYSADELITAAEYELNNSNKTTWLKKTDAFLQNNSWNKTYSEMRAIINTATIRILPVQNKQQTYV